MSVLLGNLFVNLVFFAISTFFVMALEESFGTSAGVLAGFVFLMLVIVFGEIVPQNLGRVIPLPFSRSFARWIQILMACLSPL